MMYSVITHLKQAIKEHQLLVALLILFAICLASAVTGYSSGAQASDLTKPGDEKSAQGHTPTVQRIVIDTGLSPSSERIMLKSDGTIAWKNGGDKIIQVSIIPLSARYENIRTLVIDPGDEIMTSFASGAVYSFSLSYYDSNPAGPSDNYSIQVIN